MLKGPLFLALSLFFLLSSTCYATSAETASYSFTLEGYLRSDLISFKNVVDLDSHNKDDSTLYLGLDYSVGLKAVSKTGGADFFLKLERNGPFDYNAPLFIHNTLETSGGVIERYRNEELLPQLEEFWVDLPLPSGFKFKTGLYTYEVGEGFSENGSYENYGFTLYRKIKDATLRLYYCRPDLVYKNRLGPRINQETEQGIKYEANAANFFACDLKIEEEKYSLQPYVGVLSDYTSAGKRYNVFTAPVKRDILGTLGLAWDLKEKEFGLKMEAAHNFGKATSDDAAYEDIYHTGYLIYTGLEYYLDKLTPFLHFLLCSGNKVDLDAAQDATLTSGKNRAFSVFSPLNFNLSDSISNSASLLPLVAGGAGYGLQYGVPRPGTLYSSDFDNLIMPSLGSELNITDKLSLSTEFYYLMAFSRGVGTLNNEARYLSRNLGCELDSYIDYKVKENLTLSLAAGCFFPGRYYREERDDVTGSLFSPFIRGDGKADKAYQIELTVETRF
ncbi:MAG TPA: hypothetical protein VMD04_05600 [Candidatus Margulisiibacteriota bacterium]|nr:hypothetical protein [Candidatus Margulisiibacteriota bacterium]